MVTILEKFRQFLVRIHCKRLAVQCGYEASFPSGEDRNNFKRKPTQYPPILVILTHLLLEY